MRFLSVCSGIEAASVAWQPLGWSAVAFSEIEPFPSAVLKHHYPQVPNLGDMTTIASRVLAGEVEAPDVLAGGTPCFTAGHLVLTDKGYVPVEQIKPGDMVMTHLGRLQRVVRIGSKSAEVGVLKAVGLREPMRVTADHPFLAVDWRMQNTRRDGRYKRVEYCGKPEWVEARNMPGLQWCALTNYQQIEKSPVSRKFDARQAMYVAGMYLGDGHIRRWSQRDKKALVLSLNPEKLVRLSAVVGEDSYFVSQERTSVRVTICDTALCDWLLEQFGELSHLKRIPAWVLGHEHRAALLQGYLDTDGCKLKAGVGITTTSRALAYGVADLLNAEGYAASVALIETAGTCVIEGRVVNQRDLYQVRAFHRSLSRKSRVRHGYLLRAVQSFEPAGVDTVFNIEVEGDNSYVVNGVVVHNCQAFSVAGLRKSLADARGNLTLTFCEIANAIDTIRAQRGEQPCIVFWENVPGVLNTKDNAFGCFLGALAGEDRALEPPGGRWTDAGCVLGPERAIAWRTLDAQFFGLAQRRRRVFVVASARAGFDPAAVLFEFDGVRRDTAPRREAGEAVAGTFKACASSGGWSNSADHAAAGYMQPVAQPVITMAHGQGGAEIGFDRGPTLTCNHEAPIAAYGIRTANTSSNGWGIQEEATHTLDGAMGIAVAHTLRGEGFDAGEDGTGRGTPLVPVAMVNMQGSKSNAVAQADGPSYTLNAMHGHDVHAVAVDTLYNKGIVTLKEGNASTQETYPGTLLRALRQEVGAEAFAKWGLGILDSLQQAEVLRQALHGLSIRPAPFSRSWVVCCALGFPVYGSGWLLQSLREAGCERCSSQGWEPSEQLAGQLGAYLSELSRPGAQAARFMRDLWFASEGVGLLQQALLAVQEVGRPAGHQGEPVFRNTERVGAEAGENLLSSGVQREISRERVLHETCAAGEARDSREGTTEQERSGKGWVGETPFAVRRLTVEECEFLQGFPRGYTAIPWRKKPAGECPDGPRYRALGNSWAVPVARWIGKRIEQQMKGST